MARVPRSVCRKIADQIVKECFAPSRDSLLKLAEVLEKSPDNGI